MQMRFSPAILALGILLSGCGLPNEGASSEGQTDGVQPPPVSEEEPASEGDYGLWFFQEEESSLGENKFVFLIMSETDEEQEMMLTVSCNPEQTLLAGVALTSSSFQFSPDPFLEVQVRFDDGPLEDWHAYLDGPFVRAFSPNDDLQGNPNLHAVDLQFVNKLSSHETFGVRVIDANGSHTAKFPIEGARAIAEKVLAANCVPQ